MQRTIISMRVASTSSSQDIVTRVLLDQTEIFSGTCADLPAVVTHEFDDNEAEHRLEICLSGKTAEHTQVDQNGNIENDVLVTVGDVELDGINIDELIWQLTRYQHDFNGTKSPTTEKFYGTMGCNGTVTLDFKSPIYIWLLENM